MSSFLVEKDGPVTTITFNRPERRNCLDQHVILEFEHHLQAVRDDRECRALIVTGAGSAFCAGADTAMFKGATDAAEGLRANEVVDRNNRNRDRVRIGGRFCSAAADTRPAGQIHLGTKPDRRRKIRWRRRVVRSGVESVCARACHSADEGPQPGNRKPACHRARMPGKF